jgi:hypothetical protein
VEDLLFVFVGEGPTDSALVSHLEKLCVLCGAASVTGLAADWRRLPYKPPRRVGLQIRAALELEPNANLIFVHRDADSRDPEPRHGEIGDALRELGLGVPGVAVVPVQETEAWLLLDETEIRRVAENPNGKVALGLPTPERVEMIANPKDLLFELLLKASELKGRRRERFKRTLAQKRRLLLERLSTEGEVTHVTAWKRLEADLRGAVESLAG